MHCIYGHCQRGEDIDWDDLVKVIWSKMPEGERWFSKDNFPHPQNRFPQSSVCPRIFFGKDSFARDCMGWLAQPKKTKSNWTLVPESLLNLKNGYCCNFAQFSFYQPQMSALKRDPGPIIPEKLATDYIIVLLPGPVPFIRAGKNISRRTREIFFNLETH